MYALIVDGAVEEYPASINTLKTRNPNTLFPKSFADFDYAEYGIVEVTDPCLLYTSPSPRDKRQSRMPSSA